MQRTPDESSLDRSGRLAPGRRVLVDRLSGPVRDLHGFDPFASRPVVVPEVWVLEPCDDAVVVGSRQALDTVDGDRCRDAGFDVVRRRSGGGAVLVRSGRVVWIDIVTPNGFGPDDVRGSMIWTGECWAEALTGFVDGDLTVHRGGMITNDWSDLVCFAGLGPGEVLVDGRKFVGLSQRRTRQGIRVQGMIHLEPAMRALQSVLRQPVPDGSPDEPVAVVRDGTPDSAPVDLADAVAGRLAAALERRFRFAR